VTPGRGPRVLVAAGMVRELNETLYQFERRFVADASKFERAFGLFETTSHQEPVGRTVAWFRRHYG